MAAHVMKYAHKNNMNIRSYSKYHKIFCDSMQQKKRSVYPKNYRKSGTAMSPV